MAIDIHRKHHTDRPRAKEKVDTVAYDLHKTLRIDYGWEADRLVFKQFGVKGYIAVNDDEVHVHLQRSALFPFSDAWLRQEINTHLDLHFPTKPANPLPPLDPPLRTTSPKPPPATEPEAPPAEFPPAFPADSLFGKLSTLAEAFATDAVKLATKSAEAPLRLVSEAVAAPSSGTAAFHVMGAQLKHLRTQAGLSTEALAQRLALTDTELIRRFEAGEAIPSLEQMLALATHLSAERPVDLLTEMVETYAPALGQLLQQWRQQRLGLSERERTLLDLMRKNQRLERMDTAQFEAFCDLVAAALRVSKTEAAT